MPCAGFNQLLWEVTFHTVPITSPLYFLNLLWDIMRHKTLSAAMKKQVKAQRLVLFLPRDKESRLEKELNITLQLMCALKVILAAGQRTLPVRSALPRGGGTRHAAPVKSGSRTHYSVRNSAPGRSPTFPWTRKTWSCRQRSPDPQKVR